MYFLLCIYLFIIIIIFFFFLGGGGGYHQNFVVCSVYVVQTVLYSDRCQDELCVLI